MKRRIFQARHVSICLTAVLLMVVSAALSAQDARLDLPLALVPSPDGKFVLVLDSGKTPGISVRDIKEVDKQVSLLALPDAWLGLTFAPDKKTLYASGGARGSVFEIAFSPYGTLKLQREMKASDFVGDVQLSPDGRLIYAADVFANLIAVINPQSGRVIDRFKTGRRPYRIIFHPDGKSYFVSSWADASVYQYSTVNGEELGRIRLGPHTTDMVLSSYQPPLEEGEPKPDWKYRLFVTAANTNNVYTVGIGDNNAMRLVDTIDVAPERNSPLGMMPAALVLARDQKTLFVACSDDDTVAAVDVSVPRGVVTGYAWLHHDLSPAYFPSALLVSNEGVFVGYRGEGLVLDYSMHDFAPHLPTGPIPRSVPSRSHVIYMVGNDRLGSVAGAETFFAQTLGHQAKFDRADSANLPMAGYLWTNALAAGRTIQNYGVWIKNGKSIDPAIRDFTSADIQAFFQDLKEGDTAGDMPDLILIRVDSDAEKTAIREALQKTKFANSTHLTERLDEAEQFLGLKRMTLWDSRGR